MLELSESNIHLNAKATNKLQAIEMAASALEQAGNVEQGYLQGMLGREQQTSTFLGNGIAIPHGTLETRSMVKKTGVQVFQPCGTRTYPAIAPANIPIGIPILER